MKTMFISDVHLGSRGSKGRELIKALKREKPERLFIVGDFIDGWLLQKRWYWTQSETNVIRKILSLTKQGVNVTWVTGNHDDFMRSFTPTNFGDHLEVVDSVEWNGYFITHGDLWDGVVKLKWLGKLGSWGYETAIGVDILLRKMGWKWSLSNFLKRKVKRAVKFITSYERQLAYQAQIRGCKGVICGHIHQPDDKVIELKGGSIHYLNCGDWIEHNSYIIWDKNFKLCE